MQAKLIPYRAGFTNIYFLIEDGNILLVDTGTRNLGKQILKFITSRGYKSENLKFIFLTHTHYDHAGSVAELKKLTNAQIILHQSEEESLRDGYKQIPYGTSGLYKFISWMGRRKKAKRKVAGFEKIEPDIVFEEKLSLKQMGFDAEIIHTPGHTVGSSSLVIGDKVLVGDAMFNMFGSYYPGFADDETILHETWKKLSMHDVKWFYPSHGKRISKESFVAYANKKGIL